MAYITLQETTPPKLLWYFNAAYKDKTVDRYGCGWIADMSSSKRKTEVVFAKQITIIVRISICHRVQIINTEQDIRF